MNLTKGNSALRTSARLFFGLFVNKLIIYLSLKNIILSYNNNFPITTDEIFSLMTLVKSRLTITVVMAQKQSIVLIKGNIQLSCMSY